jgi:hypothetical protein
MSFRARITDEIKFKWKSRASIEIYSFVILNTKIIIFFMSLRLLFHTNSFLCYLPTKRALTISLKKCFWWIIICFSFPNKQNMWTSIMCALNAMHNIIYSLNMTLRLYGFHASVWMWLKKTNIKSCRSIFLFNFLVYTFCIYQTFSIECDSLA